MTNPYKNLTQHKIWLAIGQALIEPFMKTYIGEKAIKAIPMNRLEYNQYRNWSLPEDEDGSDEGYLVEYLNSPNSNHPNHKGYISWSPKDVFEDSYRSTEGLTFGLAISALKAGKHIARKGWNGANMFVYYMEPFSTPAQTDWQREHIGEELNYRGRMYLKTAQNDIAAWAPSGSDALAEDWVIL